MYLQVSPVISLLCEGLDMIGLIIAWEWSKQRRGMGIVYRKYEWEFVSYDPL